VFWSFAALPSLGGIAIVAHAVILFSGYDPDGWGHSLHLVAGGLVVGLAAPPLGLAFALARTARQILVARFAAALWSLAALSLLLAIVR